MIDYKISRKCTTFEHLFNTNIFISNNKKSKRRAGILQRFFLFSVMIKTVYQQKALRIKTYRFEIRWRARHLS